MGKKDNQRQILWARSLGFPVIEFTKDSEDKSIILYGPPHLSYLDEEARSLGFRVINFNTRTQMAVAWAKKGDWECLAEYVETSRMGTGEMRSFLASVLRQEIKKPARRVSKFKRVAGANGVINRVRFFLSLLDQGIQRERAIDQTAKEFYTDRRTIQRNLKESEGAVRLLIWINEVAGRAGANAARYAISNTALTPHILS